jgi:hypothetical protein
MSQEYYFCNTCYEYIDQTSKFIICPNRTHILCEKCMKRSKKDKCLSCEELEQSINLLKICNTRLTGKTYVFYAQSDIQNPKILHDNLKTLKMNSTVVIYSNNRQNIKYIQAECKKLGLSCVNQKSYSKKQILKYNPEIIYILNNDFTQKNTEIDSLLNISEEYDILLFIIDEN